MSGIDDLNFEDLVDGAINTIEDAKTERFEAKRLLQPKLRPGSTSSIPAGTKGPQVAIDETVETMADTSRMLDPTGAGPPEIPDKAGGPRASFEHIYMRAGLPLQDFTVFRVEELYHDDDLGALDERGRIAAVRAVLKSHDVEFEAIVEDAVARRAALDAHDQRLKSNIQRVEREMEKENAKLQTEIEEYANPRIERMEKNHERVERLRGDYDEWLARKVEEQDRIVLILEPWGGDDRLRATEKIRAIAGSAPVSRDDAFEPHDAVDAPQPVADSVLADAGADQWEFESEASVASEASEAESVSTSLPSKYERATPAGVTGEFEFGSRARVPRTAMQWLFTLFAFALFVISVPLLTAQLSMIEAEGALLIALAGAPVLAVLPTFLTRARGDFWSGWVTWFFLCSLLALGVAHVDPSRLTTNLTKRPLWFIDEAGMNAEIEQGVHAVTRPYAEAIAPLFGAQSSIWQPAEPAVQPAADEDAGE